MSPALTEDALEQATLDWLAELGWTPVFGPDSAPGDESAQQMWSRPLRTADTTTRKTK